MTSGMGSKGVSSIAEVLKRARERYPAVGDDSSTAAKKNYSEIFSRSLAQYLADLLRPQFQEIQPDREGAGQESRMSGVRGPKRTDVRYSTSEIGLGFVVSIKTTHFRDKKRGDFNHNETRFDAEFRAEASEIHERSPFGVLIGLFVLPEVSGSLYTKKHPSSFARWVRRLRFRAGRDGPEGRYEIFERMFIGLYRPDGEIRFFDVMNRPPVRGLPEPDSLFNLAELLEQINKEFKRRNNPDFEFGPSTLGDEIPPEAVH